MNRAPKIPTVIGLLLLATIVGSFIFVIEHVTRGRSVAGDSGTPTNVEITNVTDASFSVSWLTSQNSTGLITAEPSGGGKVVSAFDDRDTQDKPEKFTTHHATVRNAAPNTSYAIKILSGGKTYLNRGKPWEGKTFPTIPARPSKLEPAYGTIVTPEGTPAQNALIYLVLEGGQKLSAVTKPSGSWLIPLNLSRTPDGSLYLPPKERMVEEISTRLGSLLGTAVTDTLNDSPVPEITLGKSYDFRKQQGHEGSSSLAALQVPSQQVMGMQTSSTMRDFTVTAPAEGSALPTFLPLIQGTGISGNLVTIEISIPKQTGTALVGPDGIWRYTPAQTLAPGNQILTATSQKENGETVSVTRNFEILKSGTQVLGDATPSGTLTPTPTRSTTLTPTIKITGTITPAPSPKPTPTPTATTPPVTGTYTPTLFMLAAGLLFLTAGAGLLLRYEPEYWE